MINDSTIQYSVHSVLHDLLTSYISACILVWLGTPGTHVDVCMHFFVHVFLLVGSDCARIIIQILHNFYYVDQQLLRGTIVNRAKYCNQK